MMSDLAAGDLEDLRAEGYEPTDEDVVRLHLLGAAITAGGETTAANPPRFALAGGTVFHEPTMAAREWFSRAKRFAADETMEDWLFAFACAKGRTREPLRSLSDPADIERAVGEFVGAFTGTYGEMMRAVTYVACGDSLVEPELTELAKAALEKERAQPAGEREKRNFAAVERLICQAAATTGLTFDDIMGQTPSRLRAMIYEAHVQAGMPLTKTSARAHADYLATLNAIAKRLKAEKEARDERKEGA